MFIGLGKNLFIFLQAEVEYVAEDEFEESDISDVEVCAVFSLQYILWQVTLN